MTTISGMRILDRADGLLDDAVRGKVFQPDRVFFCGDAKEQHRRDTQAGHMSGFHPPAGLATS